MSALVAIGLAPLVAATERCSLPRSKRLPRWAAVLVIYLGLLAILVGMGLLVGGTLLGVVGAILAVPTVAILQVIVEEFFVEVSPE